MDIAAAQCIALKMCSTILAKVRKMSSVMSNAWALHMAWHATWGDRFAFTRSAKLRMLGPREKAILCSAMHFQSFWNQPHCHLRRGHRTSSIVDVVVAASCNCCNCYFFVVFIRFGLRCAAALRHTMIIPFFLCAGTWPQIFIPLWKKLCRCNIVSSAWCRRLSHVASWITLPLAPNTQNALESVTTLRKHPCLVGRRWKTPWKTWTPPAHFLGRRKFNKWI